MNLKCLMGKHEPTGENLLAFAFGEEDKIDWIRRCKYCDKYIGHSTNFRHVLSKEDAEDVINTMRIMVLAGTVERLRRRMNKEETDD